MSDVSENTLTDDSDSNDRIDYNNENINSGSLIDLLKLCHMSELKEVFQLFIWHFILQPHCLLQVLDLNVPFQN